MKFLTITLKTHVRVVEIRVLVVRQLYACPHAHTHAHTNTYTCEWRDRDTNTDKYTNTDSDRHTHTDRVSERKFRSILNC